MLCIAANGVDRERHHNLYMSMQGFQLGGNVQHNGADKQIVHHKPHDHKYRLLLYVCAFFLLVLRPTINALSLLVVAYLDTCASDSL